MLAGNITKSLGVFGFWSLICDCFFSVGRADGRRTNGSVIRRTVGRTDGRTDGRSDGRTGGRTDERIFDPTVYRGGCIAGGDDFSLVFYMILVDLFGFVIKFHGQRYWSF